MLCRVANCTLWFLKPPHIEAKEELIYSVKILGGSSSVLELLETIGNSDTDWGDNYGGITKLRYTDQ